jgi:DNA gyrase/topoisomerase IV subunit A
MPLEDIPATNLDATDRRLVDWQRVGQPAPTYATEALACLAPVSRMALKEYFVQVSRRGYVKKMKTAMADSILSNRYIGTGVKQPADQTFNLLLCRNEDRLTLVSWEGYVLNVEINALPVSTEEVMRLGPRDHLVGAFLSPAEHATLVMTDNAKAIHRTEEFLESTLGLKQKGKGIYSQRRREEGVRVVGGGAVREQDWGFALHRDGTLTQHSVQVLLSSGAIQSSDKLLAFSTLTAPQIQK